MSSFPPSLPQKGQRRANPTLESGARVRGPAARKDVCQPEGIVPGNYYGPSNFFTITMPLVTLPLPRWFTAGTSRAGHDVYRGVSFHPRKLRSTIRSQTSREYFSYLPPPPPLTPPIVYFSLPLPSFASFFFPLFPDEASADFVRL